jgi:hypothetical protein
MAVWKTIKRWLKIWDPYNNCGLIAGSSKACHTCFSCSPLPASHHPFVSISSSYFFSIDFFPFRNLSLFFDYQLHTACRQCLITIVIILLVFFFNILKISKIFFSGIVFYLKN